MTVAEFIEYLKTQDQTAEVRVLSYDRSDQLGSYYEFKKFEATDHAFAWDRNGQAYIDLGSDT